jgi:hypothetical protein
MTRIDPIGIVQHIVDQDTYERLDQERYRCFDRIVQTLRRLEDEIVPTLRGDVRQEVEAYISAERELRAAEFRLMCAKVEPATEPPEQRVDDSE